MERFIAVDAEGHVWHGRLKSERDEHYLEWTPFRSEFQGVWLVRAAIYSRILLAALCSLLSFAASASAQCAWVLWEHTWQETW